MADRDDELRDAADLRQRAEAHIAMRANPLPVDGKPFSLEETRRALHDLQVHQIELEMQNEELRIAQAEIEASKARYFELYDMAPVGYCTLSELGLILEANLTAAKLLDAPRSALIGQPISRFICHDDQDSYYLHRKKLIESGEPQALEMRLLKPDGSHVWVDLTGTAALAENGVSVCRVVFSAITERKLAEERNELLQTRLTQAKRMESVGRLAGGVAHDFNNMLGVILGHVELGLARVRSAEALRANLEEIRHAAQRSADLTRQLLAFACRQTITPTVLDLNEVVESLLVMMRNLIGEDVVLDWCPGPDLWPIKMDPAQIDQMLADLCANARDAITGGGRIQVETCNLTMAEEDSALPAGLTPGEYVALTVADDGCGMDAETLLVVFEPFFTTKAMGRGTGLGLATVYGIVKQNSGGINVCSEPGRGTTFRIYLPRYTMQVGPMRAPELRRATAGGGETILLAEDEPAILRMATIILEDQGYTVLSASTPREAIRLAEEHSGRIDLLLTDVIMPEINGRELASRVASVYPGVKRMFMSGYTADVIAGHGVLDEREHFIQKPFTMTEFQARVREALEEGSVDDGSPV